VNHQNHPEMTDVETSPEYWNAQGCDLCQQQEYAQAIASFDRALQLNPRYSQAWNNRANALSAVQRQAEALDNYDRAVALQPNYHQAWFNRGELLSELMAYGNAIASYDQAIAIEPDARYLHAKEDIWLKKKLIPFTT
jgi:tetratricopeptide (TPR) repeat protein